MGYRSAREAGEAGEGKSHLRIRARASMGLIGSGDGFLRNQKINTFCIYLPQLPQLPKDGKKAIELNKINGAGFGVFASHKTHLASLASRAGSRFSFDQKKEHNMQEIRAFGSSIGLVSDLGGSA